MRTEQCVLDCVMGRGIVTAKTHSIVIIENYGGLRKENKTVEANHDHNDEGWNHFE